MQYWNGLQKYNVRFRLQLEENAMLARTERLVVEDLGAECIVYDLDSKKAHSLNSSLKWIWGQCDGKKTVDQIAKGFDQQFDERGGATAVPSGLKQLASANLLTGEIPVVETSHISRRNVMSVAVPLLTSILVPTAAAAMSREKKIKLPKPPKPPRVRKR